MYEKSPSTQSILLAQVKQMLAFWCQATSQIDNETIVMLDEERQNIFRAVQIGLQFLETSGDTAIVLLQTMPLITQLGYWQDWIPFLQRSLSIKDSQNDAYHLPLMISLGRAYRLDSQLEKAITIHLEAEQIAHSTAQWELLAQIQHDLLEDYLFARTYDKAKEVGQSAIKGLEQANNSLPLLANCYKMLGTVFYETQDYQTAEKYFSQAVTMWRQIDDPIHLARTLNDLSRFLLTSKRFKEAESCLSEAETLLAPTINDLDKCMIYINLGSLYAAKQKWARAEAAFYKANSPFLRQSVDLPRKARVNNNLGYVLFKQGKYEQAEEYLQQALKIWQEAEDDLEYANTLSILADSFLAQQESHVALPLYEELLLIVAQYPHSPMANKLGRDYSIIRDQLKEKVN